MTIGGGLSGRVRLMPSPTAASPLPRARGLDRPAVQPPVPGVPIALCGARPNVMLSGACGHRAAAGSHGAGRQAWPQARGPCPQRLRVMPAASGSLRTRSVTLGMLPQVLRGKQGAVNGTGRRLQRYGEKMVEPG
jgi:hypothetical protein